MTSPHLEIGDVGLAIKGLIGEPARVKLQRGKQGAPMKTLSRDKLFKNA